MAESLGQTLKKKVGPLPIGVWALIGSGLYVVYWYYKRSHTVASAQPSTGTNTNITGSSGSASDISNAQTQLSDLQQMAELYAQAGIMPYQGGDVYVNQTSSQSANLGAQSVNVPTSPTNIYTTVRADPIIGERLTNPPPLPAPVPVPPPPPAVTSNMYTVVPGDTLWGIAARSYGSGADWPRIFSANRDVITTTAAQHGKYSNPQNWIFPGEKLVIP